jgi:hypothetical protein
LKSQSEVSHHPKKRWKILTDLLRVDVFCNLATNFELLGKIYNQRKVLQRILIDCAHGVVDEVGAQEQGQQKYPCIMIFVFVESSDALGVNDQDFEPFFAFTHGDGFVPNPESLHELSHKYSRLTFVHGLIVGPTPKPVFSPFFPSKIRFIKKLLPVRYFPATAMTPILWLLSSGDRSISYASGDT